MGVSLTSRERWIDRALSWSDGVLLVLAFLLAWFLIGTPEQTRVWPATAQALYHALMCAAAVAGILTLRWRPPVGFIVTGAAYALLAAARVFGSSAIWPASAGFLMIVGIFFAEEMSRFRKASTEIDTDR